ncbi:MAG: ABC transporter permease [Vicinamibacterales bacterium]
MRNWSALVRQHLGPLPLDPAREADIVEELAQHVSDHHAELVAAGVPDAQALMRALQPLKERARLAVEIAASDRPRPVAPPPPSGSAGRWLASVTADARYAVRLLRRAPAFASMVIVTLALGIGANTAVFGVLRAVLLRPLPYAHPDRLVTAGDAGDDGSAGPVGYMTIQDWRTRVHSLQDIAIVRDWQAALTIDGDTRRVNGMKVSANFFPMLGVRPALGREFRADEDTQAAWRVVYLSDRLWRTAFHANADIIDRAIVMNGRQYLLAGVMPAGFEPLISERYYRPADIWALLGYDETLPYACRDCQHLRAIGLLRPDIPVEAARDELQTVEDQLQREHPGNYAQGVRMAVAPLKDALTQGVRRVIWLVAAAVALVLLLACANVTNLLLARLAQRDRELTLRVALGASRARVFQQAIVESLVLSLASAVVALAVAALTVPLLTSLAPAPMARLTGARVDLEVLLFSLALALATGLAFGLIPAVRAVRLDLRDAAQGTRSRTASGATSLTRRLLIAGEVAVALVLLTGAGLMVRTVSALAGVPPGFDPSHVLTLQVSFVGQSFATNGAVLQAQSDIVERLRALPGVSAAAASGQIPLDGNFDNYGFHIEGRFRGKDGADDPSVERYGVTPEYFAALRIPLVRGRLIQSTDTATGEMVVVLGQRTASELWPQQDPIGQRVRIGGATDGPWRTVVGIVGDVRHQSLAQAPPMQMYVPQAQFPDSLLTFVLRTGGDPALLAADARRAVHGAVRDATVDNVTTLEALVAKSIGPRRFVMIVLALFGAVALVLTAVGIYGVISCSVAERTREIGIRTALGASRRDVVWMVLGGGLAVVALGAAAGLGASLAGAKFLEASLYEISPRDPATIACATSALLLAAVAAHLIPLRRALRVEPTLALRDE